MPALRDEWNMRRKERTGDTLDRTGVEAVEEGGEGDGEGGRSSSGTVSAIGTAMRDGGSDGCSSPASCVFTE